MGNDEVVLEITNDEVRIEIDGITLKMTGDAAKQAKRFAARHILQVSQDISQMVEHERRFREAQQQSANSGIIGDARAAQGPSDLAYAMKAERSLNRRYGG